MGLPELRLLLAAEGPGCPRIDPPPGGERCGVIFPDGVLVAAICHPEKDWAAEIAIQAAEWRRRLGLGASLDRERTSVGSLPISRRSGA
jgi:hypothetical protein